MTGTAENPPLPRLLTAVLLIAVLTAVAALPVVGAATLVTREASDTVNEDFRDIDANASLPLVSTVTDRDGNVLARLYDQRRYQVGSDRISQNLKDAVVAVEDRRFYDHDGVDVRGTLRALAANLTSGGVEQGASTLDQQYIKNYLLLVDADNDAERDAATETSAGRKLREMKLAIELDKNYSKDEILTRYLNLVPFGHGAYGIEAAARTYFGTTAADLTVAQSALLAGMVQSTTNLDPYAYPDAALSRRNTVLDAMVATGAISPADRDTAAAEPLGVTGEPTTEPSGCISAGDSGFFCDYVLDYLADHGLPVDKLNRGGYTVKTTLDPATQEAAVAAVRDQAAADVDGVSVTADYIAPTADAHEVAAMASSRIYGLDADAHQTVLPVTHSMVGNGAGSVFKLFAAARALDEGLLGLDDTVDVPARIEVGGMGDGGAEGCPPGRYCVENSGTYKPSMTLREALATSPNTPFIDIAQKVGVTSMVDLAVKLGLRSYAEPGSFDGETSVQDAVAGSNMGSFVLGPLAVDPLELANVSASLADNGRWCEPLPVLAVTDRDGRDVTPDTADCEQALDRKVANALANGMSGDAGTGTAADAARSSGWSGPVSAKTGTTESNLSAAFLGFIPGLAGATYAFNDGGTVAELCTSPLRQCGAGNLFGGNEPARAFFQTLTASAGRYGGGHLPELDPSHLHAHRSGSGDRSGDRGR
ncbi:transglycosylase domain-containing protein [uncultured Corynebacterium sp.]|uniref:transglycosylase domain-containing protein n=1 Tax=uncultured Corynebacterium sp. TaxID=159447 RepID=UPI0025F22C79|nr:transglycosylase domain-containing protein [uncultured Corynebacterium sp.]